MKPGSPQAAQSAERSLMREADAYWNNPEPICERCCEVAAEWLEPCCAECKKTLAEDE